MSKTILCDADGVLLNWLDPFCEEHGITRDEFFQWDKAHPEDAFKFIKLFNASAQVGFLPTIPGAIEGVKALKNLGYDLHVVTSFGDCPYACRLREDNLRRHFGEAFSVIHCLPLGSTKLDFLKANYGQHGHFFIEDNVQNATLSLQAGLQPLILTQGWNMNATLNDDITRVDDWTDLVETIKVT